MKEKMEYCLEKLGTFQLNTYPTGRWLKEENRWEKIMWRASGHNEKISREIKDWIWYQAEGDTPEEAIDNFIIKINEKRTN